MTQTVLLQSLPDAATLSLQLWPQSTFAMPAVSGETYEPQSLGH